MRRTPEADRANVDHLTKEFLAESLEGLERIDHAVAELEAHPDNPEVLAEIFRCIHTIKGTTGFLGFSRVEKLAHAGEHLLGNLRDGKLLATESIINGLLRLVDSIRAILRLIEKIGGEGERSTDEDSEVLGLLASLTPGAASAGEKSLSLAVKADAFHGDASAGQLSHSNLNDNTLRIDLDVLNRMMEMVGELVLTRNQILQSRPDAPNFPQLARRLDSVTVNLSEVVMQARLQPVGQLFNKFPRMVRDLARTCGKVVRIEFSGQETSLDKSLLEAIKDPLTHAIRNSIDHGIETPGRRLLAGKDAEGVLSLRAMHHNSSVLIDVFDDGAGVDLQRVLETAVRRGLVTAERAASLTQREVLQLIFLPGFSTAEAITNVSGRGVGMDIIRANVEKVGGSVELESMPGAGTHLRMCVPLTLAIVPALVVESASQCFCLPQSSLAELVYVSAHEAERMIAWIGGTRFYRLRERLLPMVWLDELLDLATTRDRDIPATGESGAGFYLAVLEAEELSFGLVVDGLLTPEEIVAKPLSSGLREIGLFSGATVLGNGSVALILEVSACAQRAGVRPEIADAEEGVEESASSGQGERSFVVFQSGSHSQNAERSALPLEAVERIESVPVEEIEFADGRPLLQYHGGLLRLEDTDGVLAEAIQRGRGTKVTVLICSAPGATPATGSESPVGVVVREVFNIATGRWIEDRPEDLQGDRTEDWTQENQGRLAMIEDRVVSVPGRYASPLLNRFGIPSGAAEMV